MPWLRIVTSFFIFSVAFTARLHENECQLPDPLEKEIKSYQALVNEIIRVTTKGPFAGVFYKDLASFTDKFGSRQTGTPYLGGAVSYLYKVFSKIGFTTKTENVYVPWKLRKTESAYYSTPFGSKKLNIKSLGGSSNGKINALLMVVKDFNELIRRKREVANKIVLFNAEFENYTSTVVYSNEGPAIASMLGAVGALVRSVTPFSIGSIHAGVTYFEEKSRPIPAAAVSLEDADVLSRLLRKNVVIRVHMVIQAVRKPWKTVVEKNLIVDIPGASKPKSYVTLSGHIDSWDVGQGVLDDAGGSFLALESLFLINYLRLPPPRRTLRAILWTGKEMGFYGAKAYASAHVSELRDWSVAFESDSGLFEPLGFKVTANKKASCILKKIAQLYSILNTTEIERTGEYSHIDINVLRPHGVPLMEPLMKPNNYYWFQHTEGDSMRTMNATLMDQHLALITGTAYILANLSESLPRN